MGGAEGGCGGGAEGGCDDRGVGGGNAGAVGKGGDGAVEVGRGGGGGVCMAWSRESGTMSPTSVSVYPSELGCSLDMLNLMGQPTSGQSPRRETTQKVIFFADRSD